MTRKEILTILMPDFIKRRKIKSLVNEYNIRVNLRNQAYNLATQVPHMVYDSKDQYGESLDRTLSWLEKNIAMMMVNDYFIMIEDNQRISHERAKNLHKAIAEQQNFVYRN